MSFYFKNDFTFCEKCDIKEMVYVNQLINNYEKWNEEKEIENGDVMDADEMFKEIRKRFGH